MSITTSTDFQEWQHQRLHQLENYLATHLPMSDVKPSILHEAMAYSVVGGGKRLRPLLIYATGELCEVPQKVLDPLAALIELVHCYTLIHDDLPAMDDDSIRRGKPSCHIAYNEAIAILAGDALQTLAFDWLMNIDLPDSKLVKLCRLLTQAMGPFGVAEGQSLDICWSEKNQQNAKLEDIRQMHYKKTGLLFQTCIQLGYESSDIQKNQEDLLQLSSHLGIAFQIHDDLLDIYGKEEVIGKPVGSDIEQSKLTYPSIIGKEASIKEKDVHHQQALEALERLGWKHSHLYHLVETIIQPDTQW